MAKQYGYTEGGDPNLPGYEGFNPKEFPGYQGPTPGMQQTLDLASMYRPDDTKFNQGYGNLQSLIGSSTLGNMGLNPKGFVKGLGNYMRGGAKIGGQYGEALKKRRQIVGKEALSGLNAQTGAAGNIGSTTAGIRRIDLADRYTAKAAEDDAAAAQLGEGITQGRFGQAIGAGTNLANLMSGERSANLLATQGGMGLLNQRQSDQERARQSSLQQRYGMERDIGMMPQQYAMDLYDRWTNRPDQSSGWDTAAGLAAASVPLW
jgi:hypothetical protein